VYYADFYADNVFVLGVADFFVDFYVENVTVLVV
jgi:hypothetical protein